MTPTVKGFSIVNEAEVDHFLEFPAFSMIQWMLAIWSLVPLPFESNLYIWKFSVHILLKPRWRHFEHYLASIWNENDWAVVWACLHNAPFWDQSESDLFLSCGHWWVFQISWHIECSILTALSFTIWNSWASSLSSRLALFVVILPKIHLTSHPRLSALCEWSHHYGYIGD